MRLSLLTCMHKISQSAWLSSIVSPQVGKPKVPLEHLLAVLSKMAAEAKLRSPTWRTELAYKEEAGLAPMFRSLLDFKTFYVLSRFVGQDYPEAASMPKLPCIRSGR